MFKTSEFSFRILGNIFNVSFRSASFPVKFFNVVGPRVQFRPSITAIVHHCVRRVSLMICRVSPFDVLHTAWLQNFQGAMMIDKWTNRQMLFWALFLFMPCRLWRCLSQPSRNGPTVSLPAFVGFLTRLLTLRSVGNCRHRCDYFCCCYCQY